MAIKVNKTKGSHQLSRVLKLSPNILKPISFRSPPNFEFHEFQSWFQLNVFDLRDSPKSSQSPQNSIRAVHFFIGDDDEELATQTGSIRAVVSEIPDDGELHSILLDLGADANVFPATFLESWFEGDR